MYTIRISSIHFVSFYCWPLQPTDTNTCILRQLYEMFAAYVQHKRSALDAFCLAYYLRLNGSILCLHLAICPDRIYRFEFPLKNFFFFIWRQPTTIRHIFNFDDCRTFSSSCRSIIAWNEHKLVTHLKSPYEHDRN